MSFVSRMAGSVFGENADPDTLRPVIDLDMLSSFLPYRSFDKKEGLFLNTRSNGFSIEIPPFVGSDERTGEVLAQFFQEAMPEGADVQLLVTPTLREFEKVHTVDLTLRHSPFAATLTNYEATAVHSGTFPLRTLSLLWGLITLGSLLAIGIIAVRCRGIALATDYGEIVLLLLASLIINATIAGVLSGVHGRYAARLSWLALLGAFVIIRMAARGTAASRESQIAKL